MDRMFFWSYRPEIEMVRNNTELADRLKDIYTSGQYFLTLISELVNEMKEKLKLLRELEMKFRDRLTEQQHRRDDLLRKVHNMRHDIDVMNEENDRLIGLIVKTDPDFINSRQFRIAANPNIMARRMKPGSKTVSYATTPGGEPLTRRSRKTKSFTDEISRDPKPERGRGTKSESKNKNQSGSVLGEVTISAGSTDSLKNNLIQRTRGMFEVALSQINKRQSSQMDGCVLAEISEMSEERRGRSRELRRGEVNTEQTLQSEPTWRNNSNDKRRPKSCTEIRQNREKRKKKRDRRPRQLTQLEQSDTIPSQEESLGYVVRL